MMLPMGPVGRSVHHKNRLHDTMMFEPGGRQGACRRSWYEGDVEAGFGWDRGFVL
jgi:hypothetical protein